VLFFQINRFVGLSLIRHVLKSCVSNRHRVA